MILVTGGTGLVGSHLLYALSENDTPIRAIYRKEQKLENVKKVFGNYSNNALERFNRIEWVYCDLSDITHLNEAFKEVRQVYHCAAYISFDPSKYQGLLKSNVEGTANIVNLCLHQQVDKLCYVSSIATIGTDKKQQKATEENEFNPTDADVYSLTKHLAELEVWRGSQEGLPIGIVNPGVILGPGFWKKGSGAFFGRNQKKSAFYLPGGTGFVSVDDVVKALLKLMNSELVQERFILVSENISFQEIQQKIMSFFGQHPPQRPLTRWMLEVLWRLDWLRSQFSKKGRLLVRQQVDTLLRQSYYSNQKAKTELQMDFEPMEPVIERCCHLLLQEQA